MPRPDHPVPRDDDPLAAALDGDGPLAAELHRLRDHLATPPAPRPEVVAAHLAAIRAAADEHAHLGPRVPRRRWRPATPVLVRTGASVAATAVVVLALAAGNALPAPTQRVVARVADRVGIDLPVPPQEAPPVEPPTPSTVDRTEVTDDADRRLGPTEPQTVDRDASPASPTPDAPADPAPPVATEPPTPQDRPTPESVPAPPTDPGRASPPASPPPPAPAGAMTGSGRVHAQDARSDQRPYPDRPTGR